METPDAEHLPSCRFDDPRLFTAPPAQHGHLGVVHYCSSARPPHLVDGVPTLFLHMVHPGAGEFVETWTVDQPCQSGEYDGLVYAHDGEYLFCAGHIPAEEDYRHGTRSAYLKAFDLIERLDYRHLFRAWHMLSGINDLNAAGEARYTDFCLGRAEAFARRQDAMCAATGIGSLGGGIAFYLLARRSGRPINLENPRQQPAYRYPRQYGPRSPSFARGTCLPRRGGDTGRIYISGTASVIGHTTMHKGNVEQQCETALDNIALLIGGPNLASHGIHANHTLADLRNVKVYVKNSADMAVVRKTCEEAFSAHASVAYLNVDVCRDTLLVEVEGIIP